MRFDRRSMLAALAGVVLPIRAGIAAKRASDNLAVSGYPTTQNASCQLPTVRREGDVAVVEALCERYRFRKKASASLTATVTDIATWETLGTCNATQSIKKPTLFFTLTCSASLPVKPTPEPPPTLPIYVSGYGQSLSDTFRVPTGSLMFEVQLGTAQTGYRAKLELVTEDGNSYLLWLAGDPQSSTKVIFVRTTSAARITSSVVGSWDVTIRSAF